MADKVIKDAVERELAAFDAVASSLHSKNVRIERPAEYVIVLHPEADALPLKAGTIGLTVMGIVHGNEVVGLPVLNRFLTRLLANPSRLRVPVAFILGNPLAARENRRFLERDLNRSFARQQAASWEDRRARELEAILKRSRFLLDFHQTSEPSETPFFIFPYTAEGYRFARVVAPRFPVVTHWGAPFSKDGVCTDEFVNSHGGTGITLELGQNGLRPEAVAAGLAAADAALDAVTSKLQGVEFARPQGRAQVYTWGEILPFPASGGNPLVPGWYNFKAVHKGDLLAKSPEGALVASVEGRMLFPKYVRDMTAARPAELCRILKPIREEELGQS